jgi:transposase InsO family protein
VESVVQDSRTVKPDAVQGRSVIARLYTPSEKARALEMVLRVGITAAHRELGISRFTLYDWRRKVRRASQEAPGESPVGGSDADPRVERDSRILAEWRKHPGLGPSQVRNQLRRQGCKVSVFTVRRVLEENGYVTPKVKRRDAHDQRYEAIRPNQLWHLDFVHRYVNKQKVYVLFLVDDYSRFLVGASMWDGERVEAAIEVFEQAVARHGRPETVMSDGGSAFYSWRGVSRFTRLLEELSIDQLIAKEPEVNGKVEVLNATVAKELFSQEIFFDLAQARRRLENWVSFYNLRRTHHALGGLLVPADRYFGRSAEVLAAIETGASGEGHGEPSPAGDRQLDLLKLVSTKGQVELWGMGRRLWPIA